MTTQKISNKQRRQDARDKLRLEREAAARRKKRNKIIGITGSITGVLAVGGLITALVLSSAVPAMEVSKNAPANMLSDSLIFTSPTEVLPSKGYTLKGGKPSTTEEALKGSELPHVEIFSDYDCPHCGTFEEVNGEYLEEQLNKGTITLGVKPIITIGSPLSFNGANLMACTAEFAPETSFSVNTDLFLRNDMASNSTLVLNDIIKNLKVSEDIRKQIKSCSKNNVFMPWVENATDNALNLTDDKGKKVVEGTPTVLVNGVKYPFNPNGFQMFMEEVLAGSDVQEVIDLLGADAEGENPTTPTDKSEEEKPLQAEPKNP